MRLRLFAVRGTAGKLVLAHRQEENPSRARGGRLKACRRAPSKGGCCRAALCAARQQPPFFLTWTLLRRLCEAAFAYRPPQIRVRLKVQPHSRPDPALADHRVVAEDIARNEHIRNIILIGARRAQPPPARLAAAQAGRARRVVGEVRGRFVGAQQENAVLGDPAAGVSVAVRGVDVPQPDARTFPSVKVSSRNSPLR